MALLTIGDKRVQSATITMPYRGVWTVRATVDGELATGPVTIACGAVRMVGTITRVTSFVSRTEIEIIGGKATFSGDVTAQEFSAPTLGLVASDTLGTETLSGTAQSSWTSKSISRWVRLAGSRSGALDKLTELNGATWRVLDDGTVWIGSDTWTDGVVPALVESDASETLVFAQDEPTARPGTKINGHQIKAVSFVFSGTKFRTTCEYGNIGVADNVRKIVGALVPLDWLALYPCTVVGQSGQTLDVKPDRDDLPALAGVPIRTGVAGVEVKVSSGTKLLLGFENGNQQNPYVALWSPTTPTETSLKSSAKVTIESQAVKIDGDSVDVGKSAAGFAGDVQGLITAINSLVSSMNLNIIAYNACTPVPLTPLGSVSPMVPLIPVVPTGIVSTKVKVAI